MLDRHFGITAHPYGVLPSGNALLDPIQGSLESGHEQLRLLLSDELWQQVLGFCDGPTLGRLVQTCRIFYVAGHQPELWRDLVLRDVNNKGGELLRVGKTWKDTFVLRFVKPNDKVSPHVPIAVPGIYSDFLFRSHLCRSFGIPTSWMKPSNDKKSDVPRVTNLSVDEFVSEFEKPNRPVVLAGVAKSWEAVKKWKNVEYLLECTKGRTFRSTSGAAPFPANFSVESYIQYCRSTDLEEAPLYLFDRTALLDGPLRKDYYPDMQRTCPYFDPENCAKNGGHDLFQHLGEGKRPDHTWLIMGPKRSGSAMHIDPNATNAYNIAIVGRKRWLFYPPGVVPPGVHPSPSGDEVAMPISLGEWLVNFWDEHEKRRRTSGALECTVEPGDVVFVPCGWWHMVINLDDINIAVTHNYVSKSNLPTVLRFLEKKQDQISGCRDRAESIKPEHLRSAFTKVLRQKHPEWFEEAQALAKQGWEVKAWTDATNDDEECRDKMLKPKKRKRQALQNIGSSVIAKAKTTSAAGNDPESASTGFSFSFL